MKRRLAILLAGCLLIQPLPGSVTAVKGAGDFSSGDFFDVGDPADQAAAETAEPDVNQNSTPGDGLEAGGFEMFPTDSETESSADPDASSEQIPSENMQQNDTVPAEMFQEDGLSLETAAGEIDMSSDVVSEDGAALEQAAGPVFLDADDAAPAGDTDLPAVFEAPETVYSELAADKGAAEVTVVSALPFAYPAGGLTVTVTISNDQHQYKEDLVVAGEHPVRATARFEAVPAVYQVKVQAPGFATYTQEVEILPSRTQKLELHTDKVSAVSAAVPGWLRLGDVTGDGEITQEDVDKVLTAIRRDPYDASADLDGAGQEGAKVDLADLQYVVESLGEEQKATVETLLLPQAIREQENTKISGAENLLREEGTTTLSPAKEGAISSENPVSVAFDLAPEGTPDDQLPAIGGMTIQAPVTEEGSEETASNITGGTVEFTYMENGAEKTGYVSIGGETPRVEMPPQVSSEDVPEIRPESEPEVQAAPLFAMASVTEFAETVVADFIGEDEEPYEDGEIISADAAPVDAAGEFPAEPAEEVPENAPVSEEPASVEASVPMPVAGAKVTVEPDGSLVLDFGTQVAVKRVTIRITGTKKQQSLVEIAKVEFVNDMESRIPAPKLDIPTLSGDTRNEEISVSWTPQTNVTGYEVCIRGPVKPNNEVVSQTVRVAGTKHLFVSINDKSLKNFAQYTVKVRSVNGGWTSQWSQELVLEPKPKDLPAPPDNVAAEGGFRSVKVTWKDMSDANGYMVYYRRKKTGDFVPVVSGFSPVKTGENRLMTNSYVIGGLEDGTDYEVYVIGWNDIGWGGQSLLALAETKSGELPQLPNYKVINTPQGEGKLTANIVSARGGYHGDARMVESPLDKAADAGAHSALGVVDNNYASYWTKNDWDDGVTYQVSDFTKGVTVTLNQDYKMNYLTYTAADIAGSPDRARIVYWNSGNGDTRMEVGASILRKLDKNNLPFFIVKFDEPVVANQVQMFLGTGYARIDLKVAEMRFHHYDTLEDDIYALYEDEMHTTLKKTVTEEQIRKLEERLEAGDEKGEKHPLYDSLKLELETARKLLTEKLDDTFAVDSRITARKDGHLGFGGLNAWQPLGRTAVAGETLIVYVGHNTKRSGETSDLRLVFTQYHAESSSLAKTSGLLKVGRNEITVPQVAGKDFERAGQIYVSYEGNRASDKYGIRINGGAKIPILNIYRKEGGEKKEAIRRYVEELEAHVKALRTQSLHKENHEGKKNADYAYDERNCALNSTDIMMEYMMYSVPATQVWDAIKGASDRAARLEASLDAMEKTMLLFYQHKGLSNAEGAGSRNALPSQHLNIRYMRMFAGAFMYASGNHIGIEWDQTNVAGGAASWDSFGWGIAHEIGHDINQSCYAIAEITNNYFAQLLTKAQNGTRFQYEDIYEKVTSGAVGRSPSVGTQLGLYWQLHLAFDNEKDDRHIFSDYGEQFRNLFFARVDTYARDPGAAPQEGLELDGGVDQNLMRLACAAADRNILPFFERWGMVPDEATLEYAGKYGAPDTKALYYVNDSARDYRADHPGEPGNVAGQDAVSASVSGNGDQVTVSMNATNGNPGVILGYEVVRSTISDGRRSSEVVGFQPAGPDGSATFTDTISAMNNRVLYYEVRAVDQYLNYSSSSYAGCAKISTDGALDKSTWTVDTDMASLTGDEVVPRDDSDPDGGLEPGDIVRRSIEKVIDNRRDSAFETAADSGEIVIDMHRTEEITSVRYLGAALDSVSIEISADGSNWTPVKKAYTGCRAGSGEYSLIWFDSVKEEHRDKWIGTYSARYVKLQLAHAGGISVSEIGICGPSGDNLKFLNAGGKNAIGVLAEEYRYTADELGTPGVIPKGSLIFTGTYRGNPAYNMVILYDSDGNVIGAKGDEVKAEQVIFADVPANGNLGETSEGTWVYYVRPEDWDAESIRSIRSVRGELYRVDDALMLEGERMVSDTAEISMPEVLPNIVLKGILPDRQ